MLNVGCVFCHVGLVGKPLIDLRLRVRRQEAQGDLARIMLRAVMDTNEKFETVGEDDPPQVSCRRATNARAMSKTRCRPNRQRNTDARRQAALEEGAVMQCVASFCRHTSAAALFSCFPASLAGVERSRAGQQLERRQRRSAARARSSPSSASAASSSWTRPRRRRPSASAHAIDRGVNYFDVAPSYGNAEEMLGPALEPYRKTSFSPARRWSDRATARPPSSRRRSGTCARITWTCISSMR